MDTIRRRYPIKWTYQEGIESLIVDTKIWVLKQIKELKANPYTLQVDDKRIFFTIEFKKIFWTKYQAGMSPRAILKELNYNLDYFGQKQIDSIVQRVKKEALAGEFTEGYQKSKRM